MTDQFRAMCAELVKALHEHTCLYEDHESELVARARALLDQPTPQPPADGEVAKLVEWLQDCADVRNDEGYTSLGYQYFRAADLLQRLASDNAGLEAAAESAYLDNLSLLDSQND